MLTRGNAVFGIAFVAVLAFFGGNESYWHNLLHLGAFYALGYYSVMTFNALVFGTSAPWLQNSKR